MLACDRAYIVPQLEIILGIWKFTLSNITECLSRFYCSSCNVMSHRQLYCVMYNLNKYETGEVSWWRILAGTDRHRDNLTACKQTRKHITRPSKQTPVSYTHLDVYKRQM